MTSCSSGKCFFRRSTPASTAAPQFGAKTTALEVVRGLQAKLDGKVVLITGATSGRSYIYVAFGECYFVAFFNVSGLGVETARALATTNAHVFITARDMTKGRQVVDDLKKTTGNDKIDVLELDLTSLQSVRNFAVSFRRRHIPINILICKQNKRIV